MKYRHSYHAGNFADVHKHVALLALLAALGRKDKGFLYLETHAGSGEYAASERSRSRHRAHRDMPRSSRKSCGSTWPPSTAFRKSKGNPRAYPGSPLLAAGSCAPRTGASPWRSSRRRRGRWSARWDTDTRLRVETGDGFQRLRAHLPPPERRGLVLIDPPYEETRQDFERVTAAMTDALRRFESGVFCAWYPIKEERDIASWKTAFSRALGTEVLFSELWLYPRDSRVGLNGSGLAIVNPPYQIDERMKVWLPELHAALDSARAGGSSVEVSPADRSFPVHGAANLAGVSLHVEIGAAQHCDASVGAIRNQQTSVAVALEGLRCIQALLRHHHHRGRALLGSHDEMRHQSAPHQARAHEHDARIDGIESQPRTLHHLSNCAFRHRRVERLSNWLADHVRDDICGERMTRQRAPHDEERCHRKQHARCQCPLPHARVRRAPGTRRANFQRRRHRSSARGGSSRRAASISRRYCAQAAHSRRCVSSSASTAVGSAPSRR